MARDIINLLGACNLKKKKLQASFNFTSLILNGHTYEVINWG